MKRLEREVLAPNELAKMRSKCNNTLEVAIFEFLRSTGCRVHELVAVLREDLKLEENEVFLRKTKAVVTDRRRSADGSITCETTMKPRYSVLDDEAVGAIKRHLKTKEFRPNSKIFDRTTRAIQKMVKRWAKDAGIMQAELVHPHLFRSTTSTYMLADGTDRKYITESLGWSPTSKIFDKHYNRPPHDVVKDRILAARSKSKRLRDKRKPTDDKTEGELEGDI